MAQHLSATGRLVSGRQSTPVDDRDPAAGLSQSGSRLTLRTAYPRGAWARWCSRVRLSFLTLQRGNAVGDALRHKSVPRHALKTGRGASRMACDAERRTIVRKKHEHDRCLSNQAHQQCSGGPD
ncbi:DUF1534 domain-containing protein [Pseudomonas amygdali pv. morsprunorum]|nr:DUF1534 domain-containing protein [Pseudomonas amygdali pv. morsprunorum]POP93616.1 DUF1534 domain-containing protein [Pseudomonas amygdali pv. morsprunorum]POY79198.1 DUF1534 domain-containing protein [Pseudomonas amygdali pv. morsprunorum]